MNVIIIKLRTQNVLLSYIPWVLSSYYMYLYLQCFSYDKAPLFYSGRSLEILGMRWKNCEDAVITAMFSWWFPRFLSFVKQIQVTVAWLDSWLARLVLHCMNFELWPRLGYTFTLWCMQGNQAPQYVSHLIKNCHFSFSHTVWVQSDKEKSLVTIALAFAFLWAQCGQVTAEQPHLGECVPAVHAKNTV